MRKDDLTPEVAKDNRTLIKESDMPFEQFAQDWLKTYSRSGVKHFTSVWGPYPISSLLLSPLLQHSAALNEKHK